MPLELGLRREGRLKGVSKLKLIMFERWWWLSHEVDHFFLAYVRDEESITVKALIQEACDHFRSSFVFLLEEGIGRKWKIVVENGKST